MLIVSPGALNLAMGTPLVAPITNGDGFACSRGFTISLADAGTTTTGVVLCSQVRTLDIENSQGQWVESAPQEIMDDVLAKLASLVG